MRWRDEWALVNGTPRFITGMVIDNDELDQTYVGNEMVHEMVNRCVMFGVVVGAA